VAVTTIPILAVITCRADKGIEHAGRQKQIWSIPHEAFVTNHYVSLFAGNRFEPAASDVNWREFVMMFNCPRYLFAEIGQTLKNEKADHRSPLNPGAALRRKVSQKRRREF